MATRKAGHTGSLDPLATGVLPVCLGEATKLSSHLLDADKSYAVTVLLGITTDSGDAEGEVLSVQEPSPLSPEALHSLLCRFTGAQQQIPPMYSALKQNGKRLYELARQGIEVERPPRPVTIHHIDMLSYTGDQLMLHVSCSKGTYIRSLAMDIGEAMGCGAHVTALRRTATASFTLQQAITLEQLEAMPAADRPDCLLDMQTMITHMPEIQISTSLLPPYLQGQPVAAVATETGKTYRCSTENGDFLGLAIGVDYGSIRAKRLIRHNLPAAT